MSNQEPGRAGRGHVISGFFVFCLIGLFAVLATTLTLVGINAYRSVYEASAGNSEGQIALSYLRGKVRAYDGAGRVVVETMDGLDVLCLRETIDGEMYETRIYCADGGLREYFCAVGDAFDPSLGEGLTELRSLAMRFEEPWLIRADIIKMDGTPQTAYMALRAKEAAAP